MTTTPTASPELLDLDRLQALARAADQGEGQHIYTNPRDSNGWQANEAWHLAASPAAVLALIALARRAQPEGEAPQAVQFYRRAPNENWRETTAEHIAHLKQYPGFEYRTLYTAPAATLSPLCGAQHAESGASDLDAFGKWKAYPLPDLNSDGHFDKDWLHREFVAFKAGRRAALAAQQAAAPGALDALDFTPDAHHQVADMANVGYELMQTIKALRPDYCWNDTPAEIVSDLINELDEATTSAPGTPEAPSDRHPVQPLIEDEHGRARFKENAIVRHLSEGKLNELAALGFPETDWEQFAQLISYSLDGFSTLSYVTDETYDRAAAQPVMTRAAQLDGGQEGNAT